MPHDPSPLCCCEYININGERDHILACCCNCAELDRCVDSIICCRSKRNRWQRVVFFAALQDKMRIPWIGGAKNVAIENIFPVILTTSLFLIAAQGWMEMIISFFFLALFVTFPREKYCCLTLNTTFHAKVFYTCLAVIFLVYELYVIRQLEISFAENVVFVILVVTTGLAFYALQVSKGSSSSDKPLLSRECQSCKKLCFSTDFHSVWCGCCISRHNRKWYVFSLGSLTGALFDCSYLTLTTICRPFELVEDLILVPEDCSDTFIQWQYAICFVSGVFSLLLSVLSFALTLREVWFISIGLTITEWRLLSAPQKLCLGLCSQRPQNRGFCSNWLETLKF